MTPSAYASALDHDGCRLRDEDARAAADAYDAAADAWEIAGRPDLAAYSREMARRSRVVSEFG